MNTSTSSALNAPSRRVKNSTNGPMKDSVNEREVLGQVVADEAQVHLVDQPVAHERGQRPRAELLQAQRRAFAFEHRLAQRLVALQRGQHLGAVVAQALEEIVQAQLQGALADARVLAEQAVDAKAQVGLDDARRQRFADQAQRHRFRHVVLQIGRLAAAIALKPVGGQRPALCRLRLQSVQRLPVVVPQVAGLQVPAQAFE